MLATQEIRSLPLQQVDYTHVPESNQLVKIAKLYANAFAEGPWNEYKVCPNAHYFGQRQAELKECIICAQPLRIAYPEDETSEYIKNELQRPDAALVLFEEPDGEVLAAAWGYTCTCGDLESKYSSLQMKKRVVEKLEQSAERVQKVFYLSEIMVDTRVRKQGIATRMTQCLINKARFVNTPLVMRTRYDSPMVQVANNMQMSQVMGLGEDLENPGRVLYIKR